MVVERISQTPQVQQLAKQSAPKKSADAKSSSDHVEISSSAKQAQVMAAVARAIRNTPDVRLDRVQAASERVKNGDYVSDKVVEQTAEKILESLGIYQ